MNQRGYWVAWVPSKERCGRGRHGHGGPVDLAQQLISGPGSGTRYPCAHTYVSWPIVADRHRVVIGIRLKLKLTDRIAGCAMNSSHISHQPITSIPQIAARTRLLQSLRNPRASRALEAQQQLTCLAQVRNFTAKRWMSRRISPPIE